MKTIGDRVRHLRTLKEWSQSDLAREIGDPVKPQSIQQLEAGEVAHPRYIYRLAEVLGADPEWLLHGESKRRGRIVMEIDPLLKERFFALCAERHTTAKRMIEHLMAQSLDSGANGGAWLMVNDHPPAAYPVHTEQISEILKAIRELPEEDLRRILSFAKMLQLTRG